MASGYAGMQWIHGEKQINFNEETPTPIKVWLLSCCRIPISAVQIPCLSGWSCRVWCLKGGSKCWLHLTIPEWLTKDEFELQRSKLFAASRAYLLSQMRAGWRGCEYHRWCASARRSIDAAVCASLDGIKFMSHVTQREPWQLICPKRCEVMGLMEHVSIYLWSD